MRHHDPRFEVREQLFVPFAQGARNQMGVVVRTDVDPPLVLTGIREQIADLDPDLAVSHVRPLDDYARDARGVQRFTMVLAVTFAVMALVLGCIGLYGVMTYAVLSRRHEIGLRLALGSTSGGASGKSCAAP